MARRVVVTGVGWVTPLGHDVDAVWSRLLAGQGAVGRVTRFDSSTFPTPFAAQAAPFDLADFLPDPAAHAGAGLSTRFALGAAARALGQSGLLKSPLDRRRIGLYFGAGEGSLDLDNFIASNLASWDQSQARVNPVAWARQAAPRLSADLELEQEPSMTIAHVAGEFGLRGPALNCMTACAASTQAVGEAFEIIRRGDADAMLTGGAHSMIHPLGMTGFIRLTAMSTRRDSPATAARPFDLTRDGFVMGEGAGMIVLEEHRHALDRGAPILCEIAGFGSSADAFRVTDIQPEGRGAVAAMGQALRQAGIDPRETDAAGRPAVHYISAHGTGTSENDAIETLAVKTLFGPLAPRIPFSSVKSMLGHLIQAAGAVELITCVQAIRTGFVPPTINYSTPDPACDLDYVPNTSRDLRPLGGVDVCLSNSFGFGGQNDTICVRRAR